MKRAIWFALLVIALAALLVPLVSELVRDVLLVELLRLAWKVDRLVDSLPQEPFWLAFLFVAILVAVISALPRVQQPDTSLDSARRAEGQVADLALLIRRAGRRPYFRRRLVQRLSHLGRAVFAHRHGIDSQTLGSGLAPARRGLLSAAGGMHPTHHRAQDGALVDSLDPGAPLEQALARLRAEPSAPRGVDDPAIELFVRFLEDELEVDHVPFDRSRR